MVIAASRKTADGWVPVTRSHSRAWSSGCAATPPFVEAQIERHRRRLYSVQITVEPNLTDGPSIIDGHCGERSVGTRHFSANQVCISNELTPVRLPT
jgi:hypothetical protein